jgi:hypothetical protein
MVRIFGATACAMALYSCVLCSRSAVAAGACSGGQAIEGGYGVAIQGRLNDRGSEAIAGVMTSDGNCSLTANLFGNVDGVALLGVAATGTYYVDKNHVGNMTLNTQTGLTLSFIFNRVQRHDQAVGLENDGSSQGQIDARLQGTSNFDLNSLQGVFSYLCQSPSNQTSALFTVSYDGNGNATFVASAYSGAPGHILAITGHGFYSINPDGSYLLTLIDTGGNQTEFGGGIDSRIGNVPMAAIEYDGSSIITGPAHCVGQVIAH